MPLVVIAGHPCSGKTTVARALCAALEVAGQHVQLVSENELFSDRNACYKTLPEEKITRGKLRSETDRHISKATTVVLDSLNNIKGYRYELWCVARAAATKCCVLWVNTPVDTCRRWNAARPANEAYDAAVFDDLAGRFEPPNPQTRWDSPLHVIEPAALPVAASDAPAPTALVAALDPVIMGLTAAAHNSHITVGPNAVVSKDLRPNLATMTGHLTQTNLLHNLDRAAQDVVRRITAAQAAAGAGLGAGRVDLDHGADITLRDAVNAAELRRLKRGFLQAATSGINTGRLEDSAAATRVFASYLRDHLPGALR